MIEVLAVGFWHFGGGIMHDQKLMGQITKCRVDGITFYIRENLDSTASFVISAGERWAFKGGNDGSGMPGRAHQFLNLAAMCSYWDRIAGLVKELDPLHRTVRKHRDFTMTWAEKELKRSRRSVARGKTA